MSFQSWLSSQSGPQLPQFDPAAMSYAKSAYASTLDDDLWDQGGDRYISGFDNNGFPIFDTTPAISKEETEGYKKLMGFQDMAQARHEDYVGSLGSQFDMAQGFLMDQTKAGGMLAEQSINPLAQQLTSANAIAERQRQQNQANAFAAMGLNPMMAQRMANESAYGAQEALGQQLAGFRQDLMGKQFQAGSGLVNLSNALQSEGTARGEDMYRWMTEMALSDKNNVNMMEAGMAQADATKDAGWLGALGSIAGGMFDL